MCSAPLRELQNPGASGSIFYLTEDDEFIIKTVQHKEGEFLQKLLPGYYMVRQVTFVFSHFLTLICRIKNSVLLEDFYSLLSNFSPYGHLQGTVIFELVLVVL